MEKFQDLKKRLTSAVFAISFLTILIFFSQNAFVQLLVMVVFALVGVWAIWEYVEFLKTKSIVLPFMLLASFTVILILSNYLQILRYDITGVNQLMFGLFLFAIFLYHFAKVNEAIIHISTCFFGIVYILVPLSLMARILYPESISEEQINGRLWLAYLLIVTKVTDIGGYFVGTKWGKSKLAPYISPGKTLAGSVGGFVFAIIVSLGFYAISRSFPNLLFSLSFYQALILGAAVAVLAQIGDLAESLLKRDAKVKDSSTISGLGGGGALDHLDSLLFTAPIVYIFIKNM